MFEEDSSQAWTERYGTAAPAGLPELGRFLTHRSVRDFTDEPIPEPVVQGLVAAAQSAATSSHLQAWSIVSVQDPGLRAQVNHVCKDQVQITTASWFFAFVVDIARLRALGEAPATDSYEFGILGIIDAALAAERMVCAAESLGIGICYIGALRNDVDRIQELLQLPEGCLPLFGLCLGYPASEGHIKPRLPQEAIWHRERYVANDLSRDLDQRMAPSYADTKNPEVTWSMRMARRCEDAYLGGRLKIKQYCKRNHLFIR